MQDRVVAITGAFGRAVVAEAAERGAHLALIDHAAARGTPRPNRIEIGGIDLAEPAEANRAFEAVAAHYGRLDALINIAGAFSFQTVSEGDTATWERLYRVNTLTALNASRAALPRLIASGSGRIVNIGALGALTAGMGMGPYAASKSGVHRLTEALARELKGKVTVNAVLPSTIDTPANRRDMPKADFSAWVSPQELASVILFLASPEASAVTGALIPVSGRV